MTPPLESLKYLWDAERAAGRIEEFVLGKTFVDYLTDVLLRSAVERQFEIVGEALGQMARRDPETAQRIPDLPQIVGFRNFLAHGYGDVNDRTVWDNIRDHLPTLRETLRRLLDEA